MIKRIVSVILLALGLSPLVFSQQLDLQPAAIVRLTKSVPITVKQLKTECEQMEARKGQPLTKDERDQVLDMLINQQLVIQAAERDRITVSDNELTQQLQKMRADMARSIGQNPTDAQFAQAIKNETGLDINGFRDMSRKQLLVQKYLMSKKQDLFKSIKEPTAKEVEDFYDYNKASFVRPDTVRFTMIFVPFGGDKAAAKKKIDALAAAIKGDPAKFDEEVIRGQSPNAGFQAGDGGYLPRIPEAIQARGKELVDAAFSLKQGQVSNVITAPGGYCIIKITESYTFKNLTLDDLYQPGYGITVRQYIQMGITQRRQDETYAKALQELVVDLRKGNPFQKFESNLNW